MNDNWFYSLSEEDRLSFFRRKYKTVNYLNIELSEIPDMRDPICTFPMIGNRLHVRSYNYDYNCYVTTDFLTAMNSYWHNWRTLFYFAIKHFDTLQFDKKGLKSHIKRVRSRLNVSTVRNDEASLLFSEILLLLIQKKIIPNKFIL